MAKQALLKVIEIENLCNERIDYEKKDCKLRVELAKKEAKKIIETAKREANEIYESKAKDFTLNVAFEKDIFKKRVDGERKKIEQMFQKNLSEAIKNIAEKILTI